MAKPNRKLNLLSTNPECKFSQWCHSSMLFPSYSISFDTFKLKKSVWTCLWMATISPMNTWVLYCSSSFQSSGESSQPLRYTFLLENSTWKYPEEIKLKTISILFSLTKWMTIIHATFPHVIASMFKDVFPGWFKVAYTMCLKIALCYHYKPSWFRGFQLRH